MPPANGRRPAFARSYRTADTKRSRSAYTSRAPRVPRPRFSSNVVQLPGRQAFPPQLKNTVRYCEKQGITMTSGAYNEQKFWCNGLYDPRHAVGGHQPRFFDQMMAIYNHYTVVNSRITVSYAGWHSTVDTAPRLTFVLYKDDDAITNVTAAIYAIERKGSQYRSIMPTSNGQVIPPMKTSWSARKTFPGDPLSRLELQGTVATNPTEATFYVIGCENETAQTAYIEFMVTMEFDVVWDELKSTDPS